jgi:hypothetical protein
MAYLEEPRDPNKLNGILGANANAKPQSQVCDNGIHIRKNFRRLYQPVTITKNCAIF